MQNAIMFHNTASAQVHNIYRKPKLNSQVQSNAYSKNKGYGITNKTKTGTVKKIEPNGEKIIKAVYCNVNGMSY